MFFFDLASWFTKHFDVMWLVRENIPLPDGFVGYIPDSPIQRDGFTRYVRHLPHIRVPGACYFVTFRLADSLPKTVELEMRLEAEEWQRRIEAAQGTMDSEQLAAWRMFRQKQLRKLETLLDRGHGECLLKDADVREIVHRSLLFFEGDRCEMLAFVIMPNHVHAVVRPLGDCNPETLCGSWKWFTAQKIQQLTHRTGGLWQEETFDRVIRDAEHYWNSVRYIAKNPAKAGLDATSASVWFCESIRRANGW